MHADAVKLGDQVTDLETAVSEYEKTKKENKEVRTTEHDDYVHVHDETTANIDATHAAISKLTAASGDVVALLQKDVITEPMTSKELVQSLLEENAVQPQPEVKAFEGSSGGILKTMEDMEGDLSKSREKAEYEESDERHAYDMEQDELTHSIEVDDDRATDKTVKKSEKLNIEAHDHEDVVSLSKQKAEDEKYLAELLAQCQSKSDDFESRAQLRQEELDALQEAIDIIASKSVSGAADKHLPALVQSRSFALRASAQTKAKATVVRALQMAAKRTQSKQLARLAARVMETGPFDRIIGMIKDMIAKLTETAGEEADHKEFCDGELKENKQTRDSKTSDVNSLTATKERLEAEIAKLTEERAALSDAIAELDAAMSEATSIRQKESNENTDAIKDAKEAQEAVKAALGVLEGFYAKAAKATSFTQARGPKHDKEAPESFTEPYKGMGGGKGVIGMLEVILSDFVRLDQETSSEEAAAAAAFEEFSSTSNADKDAKTDELETKRKQKVAAEADLAQTMRDLKSTQKELNAALKYFDKLKPSCLDAGVDFAERTARREEEIASLKDALKILGEEALEPSVSGRRAHCRRTPRAFRDRVQ